MIRAEIKKEFNCDKDKLWNIITDNTINGADIKVSVFFFIISFWY